MPAKVEDPKVEDKVTISPAEFEKIPLEFIIATPLLTTIQAHKVAALTTLDFIQQLKDSPNAEFKVQVKKVNADGTETLEDRVVSVPLLSIVKVPSLSFDSLSVSFNYSIQQVYKSSTETAGALKGSLETKGLLSKFVGASFSGSLEKKTNEELSSGRSGNLEIKIHVSESPLPPGLQKIIDAMVSGINNQSAP
jgi:hypothetical protein